jgi:hypothetical protein
MSRPSSVGTIWAHYAGVWDVLRGGDDGRTAAESGGTQV